MLRVCGSNVRMPRSHSTTSWLPATTMYSAAISHSSIVADSPRLSSTGMRVLADRAQQCEVLHVARADLQHVGIARDELDVADVEHFGDDAPGRSRRRRRAAA